ncbi:hypothetical protein EUX98_g7464 [Antrodiella citrinella]|uniref:Protein CPL1-like domain-containing protein n=1 Tax=Antrodiella citrinella TaxID=2447956 RepID=A0A4S4MLG5_9APHY|nr:hypothetical protein EUX98_g7464 [Antrodiella citrinella]
MKFFSTVTPLVLAASATYVSATSLTNGYNIIKSRQAKVHRDLLDVCVGLDADLVLSEIIQDGKALVAGHLDVCLCVSLIPDFIKVNVVAQTAVNLLGVAKVSALIEGLINDDPGCQHCTFPEHGQSVCAPDWPCQFQCQDGYSPYTNPGDAHPSSCSCPAPMTECNGQCGNFPNGCGSAVPAPPQRRSRHATFGAAKDINKRQVGESKCPVDKQVCGVPGGNGGWECVDTKSDKESCGGCMTPSTIGVYHPATGKDCTSIPNAVSSSVECRSAACHVSACEAGFVPSAANDACVPVSASPADKRFFNWQEASEAVTKKAKAVGGKRDIVAAANADIRGMVKLGEGAGLVKLL